MRPRRNLSSRRTGVCGWFATACACAVLGLFLSGRAAAAGFQVDGRVNGAWYDPSHTGEGWVVEVLPGDRAVVYWFTYPAGAEGAQAWIQGQGHVEGDSIRITETVITSGPRFGPEYDPADLDAEAWGAWTMTFANCDAGTVHFEGPAAFGSGDFQIERLSSVQGSACGQDGNSDPRRTGFSGSWFDPGTAGQGITLEVLPDDGALIYWFTYTPDGNQAWVFGVGNADGPRVDFPEVFITGGTQFGDGFDGGSVDVSPWGSLSLTYDDCGRGVLSYRSALQGWDSGAMHVDRLTTLDGHRCELPPAPALNRGQWLSGIPMQPAVSEVAVATLDDRAYVLGGYGNAQQRSALEFDPGSGFRRLADLPAPRNHAMAAAHGDSVFLFGGNSGDNPVDTVWRYRLDGSDRWTNFTRMPGRLAAGSAVSVGEFIYVVTQIGVLWRLDPDSREWVTLPGPGGVYRDHANAVAFRGEIWWMAGRRLTDTFKTVQIFDPVTRTWREGPPMIYSHSGFAAAVVDGQIFVAGGEHLSADFNVGGTVEPHLEIYAPQAGHWRAGPEVPTPVHGTGGAALGGRFFMLGGSVDAGQITGAAGLAQVYEPED